MLVHTVSRRTTLVVATVVTCLIASNSIMADKSGKRGRGKASYRLVKLAPPGVAITNSAAHDLDESGNVVGFYDSAGQCYGFHYDSVQDSWLLFGAGIKVLGINNFGEMVGRDDNTGEGLYWRSPNDQNPVTLNPISGDQAAAAVRINDAGIIIGESHGGSAGTTTPVVWAVNELGNVSSPMELPRPDDVDTGSVQALSQSDQDGVTQIVGALGFVYPGDMAIRWNVMTVNGVPIVVSTPSLLGGAPSVAYGVNLQGDIVGQSGNWPFLKLNGQPLQPLTGIRKASDGFALDINAAGMIVGDQGVLSRGKFILKAVLWTTSGSIQDLNKKVDLGASETLESAIRINNTGQILGSGFFPAITEDGNVAFLIDPTQ